MLFHLSNVFVCVFPSVVEEPFTSLALGLAFHGFVIT
jgi:hypothetical protein